MAITAAEIAEILASYARQHSEEGKAHLCRRGRRWIKPVRASRFQNHRALIDILFDGAPEGLEEPV